MIHKIQINSKGQVAIAKAAKTPRQKFMSALMKAASGDAGEAIAEAFASGNKEKLKGLMDKMTAEVVKKARK